MSRTRQIPVMDITQRERMLHQAQPQNESSNHYNQANYHPMARPMRPRSRKPAIAKFRLSDTPALISNGCSSVRQLCNNVQNITMDLNNLIGSVENMVPLLNTYLSVVQSRSAVPEQEWEPPIDVTVQEPITKEQSAQQTAASTQSQPQQQTQPMNSNAAVTPPMPRPEDIQQLLENPLVRNLLTGFMQNGPFPNTNTVKENGPR